MTMMLRRRSCRQIDQDRTRSRRRRIRRRRCPHSADAVLLLPCYYYVVLAILLASCRSRCGALSSSPATSPRQQPIRDIVVAGGTHGNEYTGVWCIQHLEEQLHLKQQFPSLQVQTLLANPPAFHRNRRFVDTDLNREFTMKKLSNAATPTTVEGRRAQELNKELGPKEHPQTDLIIDLHSTTSQHGRHADRQRSRSPHGAGGGLRVEGVAKGR